MLDSVKSSTLVVIQLDWQSGTKRCLIKLGMMKGDWATEKRLGMTEKCVYRYLIDLGRQMNKYDKEHIPGNNITRRPIGKA